MYSCVVNNDPGGRIVSYDQLVAFYFDAAKDDGPFDNDRLIGKLVDA